MLNPFVYDKLVPFVDERIEKHLKPYVLRRPASYKRSVAAWEKLRPDQKAKVLELLERTQKDSVAKAMMRGDEVVSVPRVGRFEYSPAKFFKKTHAEELEGLSREGRKAKIIAYHIANRRRRRTAEEDGKKMRFRKDFAKG